MAGRVYPAGEILLKVARITKCDLHWLLTGEGEADRDPFQFLPGGTRSVIEKFAGDAGKKIDVVVNELVEEALSRRGARMLLNYKRLSAKQVDELRALLFLLGEEEEE